VGDTEKQQSRILMTIKALGPVIVVVDEADAVFGNRGADGDSGVSSRVFSGFAAHIGDSSLRGRELWIAMTSRPDLLAIDMKRQGRFGLCIPLFASQSYEDVRDLFSVVAKNKKIILTDEIMEFIKKKLGTMALTGSDVEAILTRSKEIAVMELRDNNLTAKDFQTAINSFIDPLDSNLITLQEYAAVLACSDRRFLPTIYVKQDRGDISKSFMILKEAIKYR
jgi:SpoVK/Ycf46/Vps4 family AAA+-type ATPase